MVWCTAWFRVYSMVYSIMYDNPSTRPGDPLRRFCQVFQPSDPGVDGRSVDRIDGRAVVQ
jgi:hypothetical protein